MATREKKARSVTADSPTPSLGSANSGSSSNISALAVSSTSSISGVTAGPSGSESTPTTPTSVRKTGAGGTATTPAGGGSGGSGSGSTSTTRGSLSRFKSKQLQQGEETEETSGDTIATTPSRTTRGGSALLREDSAGRDSPAGKDKDDGTIPATAGGGAGPSKELAKSPAIGARRVASAASKSSAAPAAEKCKKSSVVTLKRTGLLKRKGKKIIGKPMLGRKMVARRQLVTAAKSTGTRGAAAAAAVKEVLTVSAKEEELQSDRTATPSLRNGKPRNSDSPVAKRKAGGGLKKEESGSSSKSPDSGLMERRRSGSVSKCSDTAEEGAMDPTVADLKRELLDFESRTKMLDKMAEAFNERKAAGGGGAASPNVEKGQSSGGTLRRSMRQRKSTAKEEFQPPRGKSASSLEIKLEPAESLESLSADGELLAESAVGGVSVDAPLTIDTTEAMDGVEPLLSDGTATSLGGMSSGGGSASGGATGNVTGGTGAVAGEEELVVGKDPALSPGELVSEGVSEQSVKECYGEPAFLENNLGIEKDPKLGEIVQERFRYDKVSDEMDNAKDASVGGSDSDGGVTKEQEDSVVMVAAQEKTTVVPGEEEEEGLEEVLQVKEEEQESTDVEEDDQGITIEGVKVEVPRDEYEEVEPMDEDSGVTAGEVEEEISKELPSEEEEEKMDITEGVECVKIKNEPEVSENRAAEHSTKSTVDDTLSKTDDVASVTKESNRSASASPVDEKADSNSQTSRPPSSSEVAIGDGAVATSNTPEGDASSPVCTAAAPGKTNGTSVAVVASSAGDQSTHNQQSPRAASQKVTGGTTPKAAKLSPNVASGAATTPATSGKEAKSKTRTTKEKSKEDEKTREEKLRQEKLRVEEKVREEKQRAERLEAEKKRLKEERLLQQQKVLENGLEDPARRASPSGSVKSGGSSPAAPHSPTAEHENKTETPLVALGGLNLSAFTIALAKRDGGEGSSSSSSDEKEQPLAQKPKSELEILSIKGDGGGGGTVSPPVAVMLLSKEEKPAKEGGAAAPSLADTAESRLRTKSENAAAAVPVAEKRKDGSNRSTSLCLAKVETSNGGASTPAEERKTITLDESDDAAKRKESHLKHLGLLTIRAAVEEKQRRAVQQKPTMTETLQEGGSAGSSGSGGKGGEGWLSAGTNASSSAGPGGRTGNKSTRSSKDEYTVSMKTSVPKGGAGGVGSRGEKRKQQRMPLKMTFQKGKGKGSVGRDSSNGSGSVSSNGSGYVTDTGNNGDNTFYTVHSNELDHHSSNSSDGHSHRDAAAGRKGHSRSHTTDGVNLTETVGADVSAKESVSQKSLVIPEKASSFNVHPERLCRDQCSYCGGRFGLYDTPCHVAQIKSSERQQRILFATLPKITLDSCLCDACFRHVDRKANCPPQQKKKSSTVSQTGSSSGVSNTSATTQTTVSPLVLKVTTNKDGSTSIASTEQQPVTAVDDGTTAGGKAREICAVRQCTAHGMQSLRRKWMLKMKRKIGKHLDINLEQAARATAEYISICNKHYEQISHLMICAMCTKPLQRNQVYHLFNNIQQLERLIQEQGISVRLSSSELVVCKLCKYYANLLIKPPDPKTKAAQFVKDYHRRLFTARQHVAEKQQQIEQQQQQQHQQQQVDVTVVAADAPPPPEAPKPRQPPQTIVTDIVISDGDEEEDGDVVETEEVDEGAAESQSTCQPALPQQPVTPRYLEDMFSIGNSSVSLRRRVSGRQSSDVTIVESNGPTQMSELDEISIIPTSKSLSAAMNQQRDDNIDMTKVLKSNPNISMRELFPGEEELGVHVNIPFSTSSMRTPEGWTKVTSTIQYDDSTRALWEELQKPYGNQSSFLRHLILLEKYFRNGDLILSPQAKNNATTYSEAVQNRLRSYDNVPSVVPSSPPALASLTPATPPTVLAVDKTSNIFQQFSSATITIVPANRVRPKPGSSSSALSGGAIATEITPVSPPAPVSLLKSNNLHLANSGEQGAKANLKRKISIEGGRTSGGANVTFGAGSSIITSPLNSTGGGGVSSKVVKLDEPKAPLSSPPELISISSRKPSVTITTIPHQMASGATISPIAAATGTTQKQLSLLNQSQQSLLQTASLPSANAAVPALHAKKSPTAPAAATTNSSSPATGNAAREIIQMPEQLTEAERRESSTRPWRPTLLPIAPGVADSLKTGPLYQTADGRTLPRLVQVMSGGKPYHISIEDYNRMCILRREKLLQQQHNMIQQTTAASKRQSQLPLPNKQPAAVATNPPPPALRLSTSDDSKAAKVVQFPNQLLEQNSLIPILSGGGGGGAAGTMSTGSNAQKSGNNCSLTVTMTTTVNNNSLAKSSSSSSSGAMLPAMKPLSLPNSTTVFPMMMAANAISLPSLFAAPASTSTSSSSASSTGLFTGGGGVTTQTSSASLRPSAASSLVLGQPTSLLTPASSAAAAAFEHLLKDGNKVTQAQLQEFVAIATAANGGSLGGASSLMDNSSPAQLLSKIPKSLTVIPQQKQRSMSRVSSHEDHNSA